MITFIKEYSREKLLNIKNIKNSKEKDSLHHWKKTHLKIEVIEFEENEMRELDNDYLNILAELLSN